jgi:hypothetical protein
VREAKILGEDVIGGLRGTQVSCTRMAEDDHGKPRPASHHALGMEMVIATAANQAEADMICARLAGSGIAAEARRSIGGPQWGAAGARYVYVEPHAATQAKEILSVPDSLSDDELARLSEESAAESSARLAEHEAAEPTSPPPGRKRSAWGRLLQRVRGGRQAQERGTHDRASRGTKASPIDQPQINTYSAADNRQNRPNRTVFEPRSDRATAWGVVVIRAQPWAPEACINDLICASASQALQAALSGDACRRSCPTVKPAIPSQTNARRISL